MQTHIDLLVAEHKALVIEAAVALAQAEIAKLEAMAAYRDNGVEVSDAVFDVVDFARRVYSRSLSKLDQIR